MTKTVEQNELSGVTGAIIAQPAMKDSKKAIATTISIGFISFGAAVVGVGSTAFYFLYWKNHFYPMKYNPCAANSNIPPVAAVAKANALYEAMKGADTDEKAIKNALCNVNYNGYVDAYNAFGKREPDGLSFSSGNGNHEDLTSFLYGDPNDKELQDLRRAMAPDAAALI